MKKEIKLKETKAELNELYNNELDEDILNKNLELLNKQEEKEIDSEHHENYDHYHGRHHFDAQGKHDDVSADDFSLHTQFRTTKKLEIFRIAMAALVLGLSVGLSAVDALLEKLQINIGGVGIDMRILDILAIILGIPLVGLFYSMTIALIEPWFHFLIDSDHVPVQIAFDSIAYVIAVLMFFFIFYGLFKNSPYHDDPNKNVRRTKEWMPGVIIVPALSIIFTFVFVISLYLSYKTTGSSDAYNWPAFTRDTAPIIFTAFGLQIARFIAFYILFALFQRKMKPINHRYH